MKEAVERQCWVDRYQLTFFKANIPCFVHARFSRLVFFFLIVPPILLCKMRSFIEIFFRLILTACVYSPLPPAPLMAVWRQISLIQSQSGLRSHLSSIRMKTAGGTSIYEKIIWRLCKFPDSHCIFSNVFETHSGFGCVEFTDKRRNFCHQKFSCMWSACTLCLHLYKIRHVSLGFGWMQVINSPREEQNVVSTWPKQKMHAFTHVFINNYQQTKT